MRGAPDGQNDGVRPEKGTAGVVLFPSADPDRFNNENWAQQWKKGSTVGLQKLGLSTFGRSWTRCFGQGAKVSPQGLRRQFFGDPSISRSVEIENQMLEESIARVMSAFDSFVLRPHWEKHTVVLKFFAYSLVPSFLIMLVPVGIDAGDPLTGYLSLIQWFFGVFLCMMWVPQVLVYLVANTMDDSTPVKRLRKLLEGDHKRLMTCLTWFPPFVGACVGDFLLYALGTGWAFPVPFTSIFCGFPSVIATYAASYFLIPKDLRSAERVRFILRKGLELILATLILAFTFPLMRLFFEMLKERPGLQSIVSLFLPVLKLLMRDLYLILVRGAWMCDAASFCFVVDGFSAFFTLSLFQSVASFQVFLIMLLVDLLASMRFILSLSLDKSDAQSHTLHGLENGHGLIGHIDQLRLPELDETDVVMRRIKGPALLRRLSSYTEGRNTSSTGSGLIDTILGGTHFSRSANECRARLVPTQKKYQNRLNRGSRETDPPPLILGRSGRDFTLRRVLEDLRNLHTSAAIVAFRMQANMFVAGCFMSLQTFAAVSVAFAYTSVVIPTLGVLNPEVHRYFGDISGDSDADEDDKLLSMLFYVLLDLLCEILLIAVIQSAVSSMHQLSPYDLVTFSIHRNFGLFTTYMIVLVTFTNSLDMRNFGNDFSFEFEWIADDVDSGDDAALIMLNGTRI